MAPSVQIVLSGMLTFGVPLVLAVRELIMLNRPGRGSGIGRFRPDDQPPPAPKPLSGPSMRPLPDCLIPRPYAVPQETRVRVLEPA